MAIFWGLLSSLQTWRNSLKVFSQTIGLILQMIDFTDVLLLCLYNHDCLFPDRCDEMARRKVEPINETSHSCLIFNWPRFLCTILLCQKSFLKVSSKWLLKNKSNNGKLLLGKTYSGERFRAILALLLHHVSDVKTASAAIHEFLKFVFLPMLHTTFFPSHWLYSNIAIV